MERLKNGSLFSNCKRGKKFAFGMRGGAGEKRYCIHFMTPTNRYSWMIDFLHNKVEEFANVDAAIYFGLPPLQHRSAFSDLELEQREHNALQEEVAK
eukprot:897953-Rhodomonas_salina.1